jgi:hypothetical protein
VFEICAKDRANTHVRAKRFAQPPGRGVVVEDVVVVTEVVGVVVVVLVDDEGDVVVGLVAGATGAPVVSVMVEVLVETDVEVAVAGARTAQATRPPASPVDIVSASGPGTPSWVYRCGILAKLSGPAWIIRALPSGPFRSSAVNASVVATTFPEPSERTLSGVKSPLAGCSVRPPTCRWPPADSKSPAGPPVGATELASHLPTEWMCMPWLPGDRTPPATVSTVTVAYPFAKSIVALATGLPAGDFNSALMVCAPALVVVVLVCSLVVWLAQPANTAMGVASRAAAAVVRFNINPGYPKPRR